MAENNRKQIDVDSSPMVKLWQTLQQHLSPETAAVSVASFKSRIIEGLRKPEIGGTLMAGVAVGAEAVMAGLGVATGGVLGAVITTGAALMLVGSAYQSGLEEPAPRLSAAPFKLPPARQSLNG